jgi:hypothetical protein
MRLKSAPHVHPIRVRVDLSSLHPAQLRHVRAPRSTAHPMLAASTIVIILNHRPGPVQRPAQQHSRYGNYAVPEPSST